jgi:hypothetical protein
MEKNQKNFWKISYVLLALTPFFILMLLGFGTVGSLFGLITLYCLLAMLAIVIRPLLKNKDKLPFTWSLLFIPLVACISALIAWHDFYNPILMPGYKNGETVSVIGYNNAFSLIILGIFIGSPFVIKLLYKEIKSNKNKLSNKIALSTAVFFGLLILGLSLKKHIKVNKSASDLISLTIVNHRIENKIQYNSNIMFFYRNYYLIGKNDQEIEYQFEVSRGIYHQVGKNARVEVSLKSVNRTHQLSKLKVIENTEELPAIVEDGFFGSLYKGLKN